jgi:hypothetical protein
MIADSILGTLVAITRKWQIIIHSTMPFLQLTFHIARIIRKLYFEEAAVQ